MTYRELRQFTEIVRILGYQHTLGIDSFDTPNFALMADLLKWLATLYDQDIVVLSELNNEHGRVDFVRGIVQQLAVKSGIRLNPRKLYASDRFAVRELLKIAAPIYRGISSPMSTEAKAPAVPKNATLQKISNLSASVPKHAVELYDQLDKEVQIREERTRILSKMPSLDEVEKGVFSAVDNAQTRLDTLTKELDRLNSDEDALSSKIKQRKHEFERQSKRLMSVQTIRPAYMDEYEMHEQELQELFKLYFQHYRNVDYFEKELHKQAEAQKQRQKEREKHIHRKAERESDKILQTVQESYKVDPNIGTLQDSAEETDLLGDGDDSDDGF